MTNDAESDNLPPCPGVPPVFWPLFPPFKSYMSFL